MKLLLITILLLTSTRLVLAQEIDCSLYKSNLDGAIQRVRDVANDCAINERIANKTLEDAQSAVDKCERISDIVESDAYKQLVNAQEEAPNDTEGTNWTSMDTIQ